MGNRQGGPVPVAANVPVADPLLYSDRFLLSYYAEYLQVAIQVTITLNCREPRRTPAHLIILAESQNRTGHRVVNIFLQTMGH